MFVPKMMLLYILEYRTMHETGTYDLNLTILSFRQHMYPDIGIIGDVYVLSQGNTLNFLIPQLSQKLQLHLIDRAPVYQKPSKKEFLIL